MNAQETVRVELGARSYDIVVGAGVLNAAAEYLRPLLARPFVLIVTDETVGALHLPTLTAALTQGSIEWRQILLPPGERTKSFAYLQGLTEAMLGLGIDRQTAVVALGGGVIGDLAGFAASIVLRGVDYVQIPTTLLAQVDSSVGGKTAIDVPRGKNLIGSFYQPRLVLADIATLRTLPRRELMAGYAEVVKYGLIRDAAFFEWLEANGRKLCSGDEDARTHAVVTSCRAKAAIVAADEREAGERALLNLGHTFAHALEAETGYSSELLHGEAVAIGMLMAFELSQAMGLCPAADIRRVRRHFETVGLPVSANRAKGRRWRAADLVRHMRHDKKARGGRLRFVLVRGIGKAFVSADVDMAVVEGVLDRALAA